MQKIKDNFDVLYASVSGVVLELMNGSFELDADADGIPDGWTWTPSSGGSGIIDATVAGHGLNCFKMVHPGGSGHGGGFLESGYYPISQVERKVVSFDIYSTVAAVKNIVRIRYFTAAKVDMAADEDVYSSTSNPTSWAEYSYNITPPSGARFAKIRLIGGDPSVSTAGTTYWDDIRWERPAKTAHVKTAVGTWDSGGVILPGGTWGFIPFTNLNQSKTVDLVIENVNGNVIADTIAAGNGNMWNYTWYQRYITSSGREYWPFLICDKSSGKVVSLWCAPDHPAANNGKNTSNTPHPFSSYFNAPLPADHEIMVLDMASVGIINGIVKEQGFEHFHQGFEWALTNGYQIDFEMEIPWIPRDMDGLNTLTEADPSWTHRRLIKAQV